MRSAATPPNPSSPPIPLTTRFQSLPLPLSPQFLISFYDLTHCLDLSRMSRRSEDRDDEACSPISPFKVPFDLLLHVCNGVLLLLLLLLLFLLLLFLFLLIYACGDAEGVTSLKEKWNEYSRGRTPNRRMTSLFVSPDGEHVAVAAGNRIVILRKEDDYKVPCGVFISKFDLSF